MSERIRFFSGSELRRRAKRAERMKARYQRKQATHPTDLRQVFLRIPPPRLGSVAFSLLYGDQAVK